MKKLIFLLLLIPFTCILRAQDGVFLTYEDFKNNKVVPADAKTMNYNFGKRSFASLKENGVKRQWKLNDIWGLRYKGEIYRTTHGDVEDGMAKIVEMGNCIYYEIYVRQVVPGGGTTMSTITYLSKDLTSHFYAFNTDIKTLKAVITAHKEEFKELAECCKNSGNAMSQDVIKDCIRNSKDYKPLNESLPQLQSK